MEETYEEGSTGEKYLVQTVQVVLVILLVIMSII